MKLNRKSLVKLVLVSLCIPLGVLLIIPWLGWAWRLIRGDSVESSGALFKVPPRYLARGSSDGGVSMLRYEFGVPLWPAPYGFIGIYPNHDRRKIDMKLDLNRLQAILISQEGSEGMNLAAQREIETEVGRAVCFQFRSGKRSNVRCLFNNSALSVQYDGSEKFAGDIYELVNSARWAGGAEERQLNDPKGNGLSTKSDLKAAVFDAAAGAAGVGVDDLAAKSFESKTVQTTISNYVGGVTDTARRASDNEPQQQQQQQTPPPPPPPPQQQQPPPQEETSD